MDTSRTFFVVAWLLLMGACMPVRPQSTHAPTVIIVLRHAEKMSQGQDPELTAAGRQRAQALIRTVADVGVTAIYSSQFKRTRQTVAPLAAHLGLEVMTAEVQGTTLPTYPATLAETILAKHRGETVVVVNHSNTVPRIVEALGGASMPTISEEEYDDFFIVIVPASGPVQTIKAQYGQ